MFFIIKYKKRSIKSRDSFMVAILNIRAPTGKSVGSKIVTNYKPTDLPVGVSMKMEFLDLCYTLTGGEVKQTDGFSRRRCKKKRLLRLLRQPPIKDFR